MGLLDNSNRSLPAGSTVAAHAMTSQSSSQQPAQQQQDLLGGAFQTPAQAQHTVAVLKQEQRAQQMRRSSSRDLFRTGEDEQAHDDDDDDDDAVSDDGLAGVDVQSLSELMQGIDVVGQAMKANQATLAQAAALPLLSAHAGLTCAALCVALSLTRGNAVTHPMSYGSVYIAVGPFAAKIVSVENAQKIFDLKLVETLTGAFRSMSERVRASGGSVESDERTPGEKEAGLRIARRVYPYLVAGNARGLGTASVATSANVSDDEILNTCTESWLAFRFMFAPYLTTVQNAIGTLMKSCGEHMKDAYEEIVAGNAVDWTKSTGHLQSVIPSLTTGPLNDVVAQVRELVASQASTQAASARASAVLGQPFIDGVPEPGTKAPAKADDSAATTEDGSLVENAEDVEAMLCSIEERLKSLDAVIKASSIDAAGDMAQVTTRSPMTSADATRVACELYKLVEAFNGAVQRGETRVPQQHRGAEMAALDYGARSQKLVHDAQTVGTLLQQVATTDTGVQAGGDQLVPATHVASLVDVVTKLRSEVADMQKVLGGEHAGGVDVEPSEAGVVALRAEDVRALLLDAVAAHARQSKDGAATATAAARGGAPVSDTGEDTKVTDADAQLEKAVKGIEKWLERLEQAPAELDTTTQVRSGVEERTQAASTELRQELEKLQTSISLAQSATSGANVDDQEHATVMTTASVEALVARLDELLRQMSSVPDASSVVNRYLDAVSWVGGKKQATTVASKTATGDDGDAQGDTTCEEDDEGDASDSVDDRAALQGIFAGTVVPKSWRVDDEALQETAALIQQMQKEIDCMSTSGDVPREQRVAQCQAVLDVVATTLSNVTNLFGSIDGRPGVIDVISEDRRTAFVDELRSVAACATDGQSIEPELAARSKAACEALLDEVKQASAYASAVVAKDGADANKMRMLVAGVEAVDSLPVVHNSAVALGELLATSCQGLTPGEGGAADIGDSAPTAGATPSTVDDEAVANLSLDVVSQVSSSIAATREIVSHIDALRQCVVEPDFLAAHGDRFVVGTGAVPGTAPGTARHSMAVLPTGGGSGTALVPSTRALVCVSNMESMKKALMNNVELLHKLSAGATTQYTDSVHEGSGETDMVGEDRKVLIAALSDVVSGGMKLWMKWSGHKAWSMDTATYEAFKTSVGPVTAEPEQGVASQVLSLPLLMAPPVEPANVVDEDTEQKAFEVGPSSESGVVGTGKLGKEEMPAVYEQGAGHGDDADVEAFLHAADGAVENAVGGVMVRVVDRESDATGGVANIDDACDLMMRIAEQVDACEPTDVSEQVPSTESRGGSRTGAPVSAPGASDSGSPTRGDSMQSPSPVPQTPDTPVRVAATPEQAADDGEQAVGDSVSGAQDSPKEDSSVTSRRCLDRAMVHVVSDAVTESAPAAGAGTTKRVPYLEPLPVSFKDIADIVVALVHTVRDFDEHVLKRRNVAHSAITSHLGASSSVFSGVVAVSNAMNQFCQTADRVRRGLTPVAYVSVLGARVRSAVAHVAAACRSRCDEKDAFEMEMIDRCKAEVRQIRVYTDRVFAALAEAEHAGDLVVEGDGQDDVSVLSEADRVKLEVEALQKTLLGLKEEMRRIEANEVDVTGPKLMRMRLNTQDRLTHAEVALDKARVALTRVRR